jgi:hypothetical protein
MLCSLLLVRIWHVYFPDTSFLGEDEDDYDHVHAFREGRSDSDVWNHSSSAALSPPSSGHMLDSFGNPVTSSAANPGYGCFDINVPTIGRLQGGPTDDEPFVSSSYDDTGPSTPLGTDWSYDPSNGRKLTL